MSVRLQKFLAEAGLGSRRKCEDLIRAGGVTVDGEVAELGVSVDPETQVVAVRRPPGRRRDQGVLAAQQAGGGADRRLRCTGPADRGRLRARAGCGSSRWAGSTSTAPGVLLLTNDGELAARLLHPRYHVEKEYLVTVRGTVGERRSAALRRGVELEDGPTAPAKVEVVGALHGAPPRHRPRACAPRPRPPRRASPRCASSSTRDASGRCDG